MTAPEDTLIPSATAILTTVPTFWVTFLTAFSGFNPCQSPRPPEINQTYWSLRFQESSIMTGDQSLHRIQNSANFLVNLPCCFRHGTHTPTLPLELVEFQTLELAFVTFTTDIQVPGNVFRRKKSCPSLNIISTTKLAYNVQYKASRETSTQRDMNLSKQYRGIHKDLWQSKKDINIWATYIIRNYKYC